MMKRIIPGVLVAVAAVSILLGVWLLRGGDGSTRAQGDTVEMGIDPEVTGNTASTLGTLEDCVRVDVESPAFDGVSDYNVDVYVRGDTQAPLAYDAWVTYDASKVHIAAPDTNSVMKMPGASVFSDGLPDMDGRFVAGAAYLSGGPGVPGDGTLVRLGLDIGASGLVAVDFDAQPSATAYSSPAGGHPVTRRAAQLAVNEDCPRGEGPEPSPTPQGRAETTPAPTVTAERGSEPAVPAGTPEPVPGVPGCPDCVRARDQLKATTADVQLGGDGKYFIPDRGDGCAYRETARTPAKVVGSAQVPEMVMLWADNCELGWTFEPDTGRLGAVVP